jgi:hypothetical protein
MARDLDALLVARVEELLALVEGLQSKVDRLSQELADRRSYFDMTAELHERVCDLERWRELMPTPVQARLQLERLRRVERSD